MSYTQTYVGTLTIMTCVHEGCGIQFGMPAYFVKARRDDHKTWFCPNGHSQWFPGKSDEEKLREENDSLHQRVTDLHDTITQKNQTIQGHKYTIRAIKAAKTKIMNRVKHGVCPCCNRQFKDLQWHFESKHPELFNTKSKTHGKEKNS